MISFTGSHVTKEFGALNIRDMAVQLMRLDRFGGAGKHFWSVGMHSLLVADLLPKHLKHHGLLHDGPEGAVGEVPRPMKTDAARYVERCVLERTYTHLGLELPTHEEHKLVKAADNIACNVEGMYVGPRGFVDTQTESSIDPFAEKILLMYLNNITGNIESQMLNCDGFWPLEFERRLRQAIRDLRGGVSVEDKAVA